MTLCKMALNNVKSSIRNYWAYFLSSSFSVFIIYIFMAISYNKSVQKSLEDIKSVALLFHMGTVMIIIFSAFFIWYSNSFFTKSRKKEFATYMLLGMSKGQVAMLSFCENLIIIITSLITGIILGAIFNKFFIMLLFALMKTTGKAEFQFDIRAVKISLIVFFIIFALISLQSYLIICKSKLIDMFNAAKKIEKGLKISVITIVMSVVAIICMSYGYYVAIKKLGYNIVLAPKVVILISVGTVLFFTSVTAVIIEMMKKNQKYLFKGSRLVTVSQMHQRYRGNVGSLSVITITTTIALCALLFCWGGFSKSVENARNLCPLSVEYINGNDSTNKLFDSIVKKHKEIDIKVKENINFIVVNGRVPFVNQNVNFFVINQSEFNKVKNDEGDSKNINLKNNEVYYSEVQDFSGDPKKAIGKNVNFKFAGKDHNFTVRYVDSKNFIALDHYKDIIVVNDSTYNNMKKEANQESFFKVNGYILKNDFKAEKFVGELQKKMPKENSLATFYEHYTSGMKLMGVLAFIGLFIGILFVMATGSIIYFKMFMESREDKGNFIILRKVGISENEVKKSVIKELVIIFGAPFLIASLNTYAASFSISKLLEFKIMKEYVIIEIAYLLIYSIYYFITLKSYLINIKE
ncbi:FtsX-like permease family protein [Clostridium felsineum]|uniref:Bacitracin export permease protein BceB n=1 Tax=Clostridium felsineum TaxID=36839 RepID=A0A1S8LMK9_9CLOT|nr:FtsX-like permease family protein [Clostridium felsineum]URZ04763.1 Bacitracin export permease protein BceB [Clostridium felsineum]URZ09804.1 Bacitracin export permease protein BceB [Clostridium felsineum]